MVRHQGMEEGAAERSRRAQLLEAAPARSFLAECRRLVTLKTHDQERVWSAGTCLLQTIDEWPFRLEAPPEPQQSVLVEAARALVTDESLAPWWAPIPAASSHLRLLSQFGDAARPVLTETASWEVGPEKALWSIVVAPWSWGFLQEVLRKYLRPDRHQLQLLTTPSTDLVSVTDRDDWARLCADRPNRLRLVEKEYWAYWADRLHLDDDVVLPDWGRLRASGCRGVYLAPGGYATCEASPVRSSAGLHLMLGWLPGMTLWLDDSPWSEAVPVELADLERLTTPA